MAGASGGISGGAHLGDDPVVDAFQEQDAYRRRRLAGGGSGEAVDALVFGGAEVVFLVGADAELVVGGGFQSVQVDFAGGRVCGVDPAQEAAVAGGDLPVHVPEEVVVAVPLVVVGRCASQSAMSVVAPWGSTEHRVQVGFVGRVR